MITESVLNDPVPQEKQDFTRPMFARNANASELNHRILEMPVRREIEFTLTVIAGINRDCTACLQSVSSDYFSRLALFNNQMIANRIIFIDVLTGSVCAVESLVQHKVE